MLVELFVGRSGRSVRAAALVAAALVAVGARAQEAQPIAAAPAGAPAAGGERVFVGASLGKGAGLVGAFVAFRASDRFGLEAGIGKRLVLISFGSTSESLWPTAMVGKAQFYFANPGQRFQSGLEAGVMYSADIGTGGEAAYFARLSLGSAMFLDCNLGLAFMPQAEEKGPEFAARELGGSPSSYDMKTTPVALMWGLGIGWAF